MKEILVISPHPDDETLGCGGTLLGHRDKGDKIHWLIVTEINTRLGYSPEQVDRRCAEIEQVAARYGFSSVHKLNLSTTKLDSIPIGEIIDEISGVFKKVSPEIIYAPYRGDIHTDHRIILDAVASCTKWFRNSSVKRLLSYEVISETDFAINPDLAGFRPNVFIDISKYIETKLEIFKIYTDELGEFPFPRSEKAIRALATLRGAQAGCEAAEAFMLLKEIR